MEDLITTELLEANGFILEPNSGNSYILKVASFHEEEAGECHFILEWEFDDSTVYIKNSINEVQGTNLGIIKSFKILKLIISFFEFIAENNVSINKEYPPIPWHRIPMESYEILLNDGIDLQLKNSDPTTE